MEYYLAIKRMKYAIFSDMYGPRDYYTEWSKSARERQISYDITYMWKLIKMITKEFILKNRNKVVISKPILWLP